VGFEGEDGGGGALAQINTIRLGDVVFNPGQVVGQPGVEGRHLRGEEGGQRVVSRLADGRFHGDWAGRDLNAGITLESADDGVQRVEHGDMDNRDRAACSTGAKLLPPGSGLQRARGRVVQPTSVNRDLIPATDRVQPMARALSWSAIELLAGD